MKKNQKTSSAIYRKQISFLQQQKLKHRKNMNAKLGNTYQPVTVRRKPQERTVFSWSK